jgi:SET domain
LIKRHKTSDPRFEIRERSESGHKSLHARTAHAPGETLARFSARATLSQPAVHTVQISAAEHILLDPAFLEYTNHSCSPNVLFDVEQMVVIAIEPIDPGDEIVYFYPSTETSMSQPFSCRCDSGQCLGLIEGAEYLPDSVLDRYRLADHVRSMLLLRQIAS